MGRALRICGSIARRRAVALLLLLVTGMVVAGAAGGVAAVAAAAAVETFPDKPIRFIVPFPPGGPADVIARVVGEKLRERWGQPVVVDNRPGAGGNVGMQLGAQAAPDGHTIV